jgi:lipopolysaccharide/colanic/teichoic acid biosynthesis glycosyltransferase
MLILFTWPIILFAMLVIKLDSPGPILYIQQRVGLYGNYFQLFKLRTMREGADQSGPEYTLSGDSRITRIGSFLRIRRLDELPQLINVLKGEMSLVGPRPLTPLLTQKYHQEELGFIHRLSIQPGLTGLVQVSGGDNLTIKEKVILDAYYMKHISFTMDLKILLKTCLVILTGDGAR